MDIVFYRRKSDGELLTAAELKVAVKPNMARTQVFLANDPAKWHDGVMAMIGYERVLGTKRPESDDRLYWLDGRHAEQLADGRWHQKWERVPRFASDEEARQLKIAGVEQKLQEALRSRIEVEGVTVRIDDAGAASVAVGLQAKGKHAFVAKGRTKTLSHAAFQRVAAAVAEAREAKHANAARLIEAIEKAPEAEGVNIDEGW